MRVSGDLLQALAKYPRAYQPKSVQGFAAMDSARQVESYPAPALDAEGVEAKVAAMHARGYPVLGYAGSIYEWSWWLRGMEQFLVDLLESPSFAQAIIARPPLVNPGKADSGWGALGAYAFTAAGGSEATTTRARQACAARSRRSKSRRV